jgi:hypothetical protein
VWFIVQSKHSDSDSGTMLIYSCNPEYNRTISPDYASVPPGSVQSVVPCIALELESVNHD